MPNGSEAGSITVAYLSGQVSIRKMSETALLGTRKGTGKDKTPTGTTRSRPSTDSAGPEWHQLLPPVNLEVELSFLSGPEWGR